MPEIGNFDASEHDAPSAFDPLPAGWYAVQAVQQEIRENKDRTGKYLWIEFELLEQHHPEYKGRKVWERLNLWNSSPDTVRISQQHLAGFILAAGMKNVTNTDVLNHTPVACKLKVEIDKEGRYDPANRIVAFDAVAARFHPGGGPAPAPASKPAAPPSSPQTSSAPPATSTPPWQR